MTTTASVESVQQRQPQTSNQHNAGWMSVPAFLHALHSCNSGHDFPNLAVVGTVGGLLDNRGEEAIADCHP